MAAPGPRGADLLSILRKKLAQDRWEEASYWGPGLGQLAPQEHLLLRQGAPAPRISSLSLALRGPPKDTGRCRGAGMNTSHGHCVESPRPWSPRCGIDLSVGLGGQSTTRSHLSCCHEATSPTTSGRFLLLPVPCAPQPCLLRVLRGFTGTLCTGLADCPHGTCVCALLWVCLSHP